MIHLNFLILAELHTMKYACICFSLFSNVKLCFMKNQLFWAICSFSIVLAACGDSKPIEEVAQTVAPDSTAAVAPAEFADAKYAEIVRNGQKALSAGDVSGWLSAFADNAVFAWNSGDSLSGKAAISEFWTKRRGDIIESLTYTNQIFLPVKVNKPQSVEAPGVWVLSWWKTEAKYKTTGKKMTQWIHATTHFNDEDKIDRVIQYIDMAPINAALTK
jgi:ketosteroid isomerase-like protein